MRKHYKLVSSIACIVLCIAIVAFGVYAASNSLVKLSATVSFTPTMAKLTIRGGIANAVDNIETGNQPTTYGYYATNFGGSPTSGITTNNNIDTFPTWSYGTANFNNKNTDQADPIYFFVQITNHVENNIDILVKFTTDFSTDTNLKVSYCTNVKLNSAINANTVGMYSLSDTTKPTQGTTNGLVSAYSATTFEEITYNTTASEAEISISNQASLSTVMLVIKLEVADQAENVDLGTNDAFNFVIDVKNVGTNKE